MDHWIPLASLCEREKTYHGITLASCGDGSLPETKIWQISARRLRHVTLRSISDHTLWVSTLSLLETLWIRWPSNAKEMQRKCKGTRAVSIVFQFQVLHGKSEPKGPKGIQRACTYYHIQAYTLIYHHIPSYTIIYHHTIIIPANNCKYLSSQPIIHHPSQPKIHCTSSVGFSGNDRRSTPLVCVFPYERG